MFVPTIIVETVVPTMIVGTAVPTIIVLTAYYWKSCVRVGTLLMEVPGTPIGASFFKFELKPTRKDSADPTKHEIQHHIV